ncbi:MAG: hypothetical protein ACRC6M_01635 [Microcystaceae cyanobacterium]
MKNSKKNIAEELKFKQSIWQLGEILPYDYQLPSQLLEKIDPDLHNNFCLLLSRDVYSEGDSEPLFNYLRSYALTKKVEYVKRGNSPLLINVKWQDNYLNHRQQSVTVICTRCF